MNQNYSSQAAHTTQADGDVPVAEGSSQAARTSLLSTSQWLVGLSSLILPAAYVLGRTYADSWARTIGFHASVFTAEVDEVLFYSYVAALKGVSGFIARHAPWLDTLPGLWLLALLALFGLALAWSGLSSMLSAAVRSRLGTARRRVAIDNRFTRALAWAYFIASAPILLLGVGLYLVLIGITPAVVGERIGRAEGASFRAEALERLATGNYLPHDQFARLAGDSSDEVHLVVKCGGSGCGVISRDGSRFVAWNRIERIEESPP